MCSLSFFILHGKAITFHQFQQLLELVEFCLSGNILQIEELRNPLALQNVMAPITRATENPKASAIFRASEKGKFFGGLTIR